MTLEVGLLNRPQQSNDVFPKVIFVDKSYFCLRLHDNISRSVDTNSLQDKLETWPFIFLKIYQLNFSKQKPLYLILFFDKFLNIDFSLTWHSSCPNKVTVIAWD